MNWRRIMKWAGGGLAGIVVLIAIFAGLQMFLFDRMMDEVLERPEARVTLSTDSAVLARGEHLALALGNCMACHGQNLEGRVVEEMGPIGIFIAPNLTRGVGGVGDDYTDDELAMAIRWGVRPDGRSLLFMPTAEHNWWSDDDLTAVVSYVRSVPPVDNTVEPSRVGPMGKVLGNLGVIPWASARMVDPASLPATAPDPEPTARYGFYLGIGCTGCHGESFAGGPIPGAPSSLPVPLNITPHSEGLANWTFETFEAVIESGNRPDGTPLDPFMPIESLRAMDDTERTALWEYLRTLEPLPTGSR